jgi:hypothetical protein
MSAQLPAALPTCASSSGAKWSKCAETESEESEFLQPDLAYPGAGGERLESRVDTSLDPWSGVHATYLQVVPANFESCIQITVQSSLARRVSQGLFGHSRGNTCKGDAKHAKSPYGLLSSVFFLC